ncbi:MAG: glycosyltransferase family 39 protein [Bryobacterales bacterium]|nr:glycosyltransferase family 39 protein [Bryobacterales bacterium]
MQAVLILAGALATGVVSLAFGQALLSLLRLPLKGLERATLAFLTGSVLLSIAVFLLAAAGLARREAYLALGILAIVAARGRPFSFGRTEDAGLGRAWRIAAALAFAVFTCIYLLHAMAPEHSPDGSSYHLGLVSFYNDAGGLVKTTDNMYALFPQGIEMLFLYAFSIGRHSAASLVEFSFLAALAILLYASGRRMGDPVAGLFASFAVYASPIVGWTGTCAYIDVAVAALVFGMFHLLYRWEEGLPGNALAPAGLLAGAAFGAKYTAFIAVPFGVLFILIVLWRRRTVTAAPLTFMAAAVPAFSGWLIRNWVWTGNPFAPFLNRWFPNPHFFPSFEVQLAGGLRWPDGLGGWRQVPLELTLRGGPVQGLLGPLFLLAPVALLSLRYRAGRRLVAAALAFAAVFPWNKGTRFLLLSLPFLALAMGLSLAKKRWLTGALLAGHAIASYPAAVDRYADPYAVRLDATPGIREALRAVPEEEYLSGKRFGYGPARLVDRIVPSGEGVFSFVTFQQAYARRPVLVYHTSARGNLAGEAFFTAMDATSLFGGRFLASGVSPDLAPVCEMSYRFSPRQVRGLRLVQRRTAPAGLWVATDVQASLAGREVPWPAATRYTASHSRWYAPRAFDVNPLTLWSSREPVQAGMYLAAEFTEPVEIDGLTVRAPRGQDGLSPELEAMSPGGAWVEIEARPRVSIVPVPPGLRAAAARQLRREGIGYLLVVEGNLVADDLRERAREWRIEAAGSSEDFTLYRILP